MTEPLVSQHCAALAAIACVLCFLCLALGTLLAATYKRIRLGSRLLAECGGDVAQCWAEIAAIHRANLAADKLQRRAWDAMRKRGAS